MAAVLLTNLGAGTQRIDLQGIVKTVLGFAMLSEPAMDTDKLASAELQVEMSLSAARQSGSIHLNGSGPELYSRLSAEELRSPLIKVYFPKPNRPTTIPIGRFSPFKTYVGKFLEETVGAYTAKMDAQRKMNPMQVKKWHSPINNFANVEHPMAAKWTGAFSGPPVLDESASIS